ncbi:MAG: antitoxin Xre/MbcA/ParS toxin-binding domain-containing protein [Acidobacteriota bacterium]
MHGSVREQSVTRDALQSALTEIASRLDRDDFAELDQLSTASLRTLNGLMPILSVAVDQVVNVLESRPIDSDPDDTVEVLVGEPSKLVSADESKRRLDARTRRVVRDDELLTSDEMAERLKISSRQTVHNKRQRGDIVGWKTAKRSYVFPAEQIAADGRLVPQLADVQETFGEPLAAWNWLTHPEPALDGQRPLDVLRSGGGPRVMEAAVSFAQGDFL